MSRVEVLHGRAGLHLGDCLSTLREIPDGAVDAVVTDPPYGISFMGKEWDYDIPECAVWAECLRVLRPGGVLLAFSSTRTQHRMAVRIEDAGFEIRDMIAWVYGSGWPKSAALLKPALDPITVACKPADRGAGAMQIPVCMVPAPVKDRWPSNLIHDGSAEVVSAFPETPGQLAKASVSRATRRTQNTYGALGQGSNGNPPRGDTGSASRFFYCAKASPAERNRGTESGNSAPTVKPISLMRYLCRLATPAGGVVLDPFMGSGSTGVAALLEGFRFIGIEKDLASLTTAAQRIRAYAEYDKP